MLQNKTNISLQVKCNISLNPDQFLFTFGFPKTGSPPAVALTEAHPSAPRHRSVGRLQGARRIWPLWKWGFPCESLQPHWEAKPRGDGLAGLGCNCTPKSQIRSHIPGAGPQPGGSDEPPAVAASPPGAVLLHGDGTPGWAQVWGELGGA